MPRRLAVLVTLILAALTITPPASAGKSCGNCEPTVVVVNGDGTATASTTALPKSDCIRHDHATTGECTLNVWSQGAVGMWSVPFGGGPVTFPIPHDCPCTAQFIVHAGSPMPYSAKSDPFTP